MANKGREQMEELLKTTLPTVDRATVAKLAKCAEERPMSFLLVLRRFNNVGDKKIRQIVEALEGPIDYDLADKDEAAEIAASL